MKKIFHFIVTIPVRFVKRIIRIRPKQAIISLYKGTLRISSFIILLLTYIFEMSILWLSNRRLVPTIFGKVVNPPIHAVCNRIYRLNRGKESSFNRLTLIQIALKNMSFKPARTIITVGGMAVGIAAIVFLVSLGYGLQRLVVSRVARLEELKQTDVVSQVGSQLDLTDETIATFTQIPEVKYVLPLITLVGRINYQNSISDVAVFGVTSEYLRQSDIQPVEGTIFESDDLAHVLPPEDDTGQVAGVSTEVAEKGAEIGKVSMNLYQDEWIKVRSGPGVTYPEIGYTKRSEGTQEGVLVWGESYKTDTGFGEVAFDAFGVPLGQWVKSPVYLWEKTVCDPLTVDCVDGQFIVKRGLDTTQDQGEGYMGIISMDVTPFKILQKSVLGISAVLADETATASALPESTTEKDATSSAFVVVETEDGFVEIDSETGSNEQDSVKIVEFGSTALRQAVVSRAMLQILGLSDADAVGKTFDVAFIVTGDLLDTGVDKVESESVEYTIVGVDSDENSSFFYVPFLDLRSLGITKYSQIKVVAKSDKDVEKIRTQIESSGYVTSSVADTVIQIDSLFQTVRLLLGSIGLVALAVAGLGMFNTMSISLLERTREVGLMKAMGMRSNEVHELFLTESMTMGFFGGVFGILIGTGVGKIIGLILSIFSVSRGVGYVDISYLPIAFTIFIIVLSIIVGIVTGIYPARRATKISALNALRYE